MCLKVKNSFCKWINSVSKYVKHSQATPFHVIKAINPCYQAINPCYHAINLCYQSNQSMLSSNQSMLSSDPCYLGSQHMLTKKYMVPRQSIHVIQATNPCYQGNQSMLSRQSIHVIK